MKTRNFRQPSCRAFFIGNAEFVRLHPMFDDYRFLTPVSLLKNIKVLALSLRLYGQCRFDSTVCLPGPVTLEWREML